MTFALAHVVQTGEGGPEGDAEALASDERALEAGVDGRWDGVAAV